MESRFPDILLTNLSAGYRNKEGDKVVLESFSTRLKPGEVIALMGSNGSGKSTLLRTLTGFQLPLAGSVTLNGRMISSISMKERAGYLSYVSTEPVNVGAMTVFELVGLGRYLYSGWWGSHTKEDVEMINRCLAITGMSSFSTRQVYSLSDGERQRVMIARALAQDTPVMVLDEPTAFLDVRNKHEIIHLLRDLSVKEQKSVIFSSHDFNITLGLADKVWLLENGKVEEGAPEDLALKGAYNVLFEGSPLAFIPESGEIVLTEAPVKAVNVTAEGTVRFWLEKALQRNGYYHDDTSPVRIEVSTQEGKIMFRVVSDEFSATVYSVYELIAILTHRSN